MAEWSWTPSQESAFSVRGKNLLVSAAAGSGKTAVLTERILALLLDEQSGVALSDIVAITFTRAAAASLKEKLSQRIEAQIAKQPQNRRLYHLLMEIPRANLSTVHAFCYRLVRENAAALGLSSTARIGSEAQLSPLREDCADRAIRFYLDEHAQNGLSAAQKRCAQEFYRFCIAGRNDRYLDAVLLGLYDELRATEEGVPKLAELGAHAKDELLLLEKGDLDFFDTALGMRVAESFACALKQALSGLAFYMERFPADERDEETLPAAAALWEILHKANTLMQSAKPTLAKLAAILRDCETMGSYKNKSATIPTSSEEGKALKALFDRSKAHAKRIGALCDGYLATQPEAEHRRLAYQEIAAKMLYKLDEYYAAAKREAQLLDYADLERFALQALKMRTSPVCKALFVDEYQDTNRLQDRLFAAAAKGSEFFFVGDVKQSIYGFRYARPELFLEYKNSFTPYREGVEDRNCTLFLSDNFRSDESVIDFANEVCEPLMNDNERKEERLYGAEDRLVFHKGSTQKILPELWLFEREHTALDEADLVVERVRSLLSEGYAPEDIAVLAYTNRYLEALKPRFSAAGIPVGMGDRADLFEQTEVQSLLAVMQAIDNPADDIPLAALLTCPLFSFSSDSLSRIAAFGGGGSFYNALCAFAGYAEDCPEKERAAAAIAWLSDYRRYALDEQLSLFVLRLIQETGFAFAFCAEDEEDAARRDNLFAVYSAARAFESGGRATLGAFLRHLERQRKKAPEYEAREEAGRLTLMTVYKAKGLQFRACILAQLGRSFLADAGYREGGRQSAPAQHMVFDPAYGLFFADYDAAHGVFTASVRREFVSSLRERRNLEEQKRILYVALTRAEERLILIASTARGRRLDSVAANAGLCPPLAPDIIRASDLGSPLELLLRALSHNARVIQAMSAYLCAEKRTQTKADCGTFTLFLCRGESLSQIRETKSERQTPRAPFCESTIKDMEQAFLRVLENRESLRLPAKVSVSELSQLSRDEGSENAVQLSLSAAEFDAAAKGTAMHAFMQYADYARAAADARAESARLVELAFLTPAQAQALNFTALYRFFTGGLYAEMKQSPRVSRELRFNVFLPANTLFETQKDTDILVQGVVDCFFEKPDGTLCVLDFKTDALNPKTGKAVLLSRHAKQLRLYKRAVEEITQKRVSSLLLYSFSLGGVVEVPPA